MLEKPKHEGTVFPINNVFEGLRLKTNKNKKKGLKNEKEMTLI